MRVVIDGAIPYIEGIVERYAEVCYLPAEEITSAAVHSADALIIRTRTKCNRALLDGSSVKFIATLLSLPLKTSHYHNEKLLAASLGFEPR